MTRIPAGAYTLIGALIGAAITLATTWLGQRGQRALEERKAQETRKQLVSKEKSERVYQLVTDLSAAAYSFLWITWGAQHDDLDQKTLQQYWDDMRNLMPRVYADYVLVAGLDDDLGQLAGSLVDQADVLDDGIGKATLELNEDTIERLKSLRPLAETFAKSVAEELATKMKEKRLDI
jgi:hypothetical protein